MTSDSKKGHGNTTDLAVAVESQLESSIIEVVAATTSKLIATQRVWHYYVFAVFSFIKSL